MFCRKLVTAVFSCRLEKNLERTRRKSSSTILLATRAGVFQNRGGVSKIGFIYTQN